MRPFFVYGTLKRGQSNYARLLAGQTVSEARAWLPGAALYTAGPYPFLVQAVDLVPPGSIVFGELMEVAPAQYQRVLALLDELEDFAPGRVGNLYERVALTVQTDAGPREAWVYIAGSGAEAAIRHGRLRLITGGVW
ncbi:gamma-glutamylcyclotransferase family protein [Chloroflexus sp.]|uniref:gamma-glutamylcyclotransferase family protein n=1 Tax=Chloroflexus sp. TaxID=1904827 RepID=UPI002ACD9682|nr:gamma-glutamylcyclotransferase family protein [Chloroflexus sp.]